MASKVERTKCCSPFFWISWDIFVRYFWDIFCEIFLWDVNVKKLGHNPSSYQLPRSEQGEENKMLSCIFWNIVRYFCEIFTWDILMRYSRQKFWRNAWSMIMSWFINTQNCKLNISLKKLTDKFSFKRVHKISHEIKLNEISNLINLYRIQEKQGEDGKWGKW